MDSKYSYTDKSNDVTVIVLAGGKSTRMGRDKGLLPYQESSFGENVLSIARKITPNVLVSVNQSNQDYYNQLDTITILDAVPEKGPLGGIVSVLRKVKTTWFFVITVDSPLFTNDLFDELWSKKGDKEAVIFSNKNQTHPLLALYHMRTIPKWSQAFKNNQLKVTDLVNTFNSEVIELQQDQIQSVTNVNTRFEYNKLKINEL